MQTENGIELHVLHQQQYFVFYSPKPSMLPCTDTYIIGECDNDPIVKGVRAQLHTTYAMPLPHLVNELHGTVVRRNVGDELARATE